MIQVSTAIEKPPPIQEWLCEAFIETIADGAGVLLGKIADGLDHAISAGMTGFDMLDFCADNPSASALASL